MYAVFRGIVSVQHVYIHSITKLFERDIFRKSKKMHMG